MAHANPLPEDITVLRCASCGRMIGLAKQKNALRNAAYCDDWCIHESPITPNEERNDQWEMLVALGWSPVAVARLYDAPHSQVYRHLAKA